MRPSGLESRTKAPFEMVIIHGFAEGNRPLHPSRRGFGRLIRICGDENRRDHVARIDEVSVELNPGHSRHLDVGDQAPGFRQEEAMPGNRLPRESFDGVAQRRHEFSHGFAKGLIILDNRDQCTFRHRSFILLDRPLPATFQSVSHLHVTP